MKLGIVKPEKMLVIWFDRDEFHIGTTDNPIDGPNGQKIFEKFAPIVDRNGDFQLFGTKELRTHKSRWKVINYGTITGLPKLGLGLVVHPENKIFKAIDKKNIAIIHNLQDRIMAYEKQIRSLQIKLERIAKSPEMSQMRTARSLGKAVSEAKGWKSWRTKEPTFRKDRQHRRGDEDDWW